MMALIVHSGTALVNLRDDSIRHVYKVVPTETDAEREATIIAGSTDEAIAALDAELSEGEARAAAAKRHAETGVHDDEWAAAIEEERRKNRPQPIIVGPNAPPFEFREAISSASVWAVHSWRGYNG